MGIYILGETRALKDLVKSDCFAYDGVKLTRDGVKLLYFNEVYQVIETSDIIQVNDLLKLGYKLINTYIKVDQSEQGMKNETLLYVLGVDKKTYLGIDHPPKAERSPEGWQEEYK
tara:strand:+ start:33 stop:377 length:345 start_codon:yes stop_codon:yes gene_type:complete